MNVKKISKGLGWLSLGLGVAEVLAGKAVGKAVGAEDKHKMVRGHGLREIASGAGMLAGKHQGPLMWSRMAGNAMEIASLGASLMKTKSRKGAALAALGAVAVATVIDVLAAKQAAKQEETAVPSPS